MITISCLWLAIVSASLLQVNGQEEPTIPCYSCRYNVEDTRCLHDPASIEGGIRPCPVSWWCRTERQEYAEQPGVIHGFDRLCTVEFANKTDVNSQWVHYYTSCNTELCNSGNGLRPGETTTKKPGGSVAGQSVALHSILIAAVAVSYVVLAL